MSRIRFIAVRPTPASVKHLLSAARADPVGPWLTEPNGWHVTVAFLGRVRQDRSAAVRTAVTGSVAGLPAPRLRLTGGGAFGRAQYVGVDGDLVGLAALADRVRSALDAVGQPYDSKPFVPHLTIARRPTPEPQSWQDYRGPWFTPRRLLMCGERLDTGYRVVDAVRFTG